MKEQPFIGLTRREAILGAAALGIAWTAGSTRAQTYPVKTIRIVVPYAPGGYTDVIARLVAQKMTAKLGQPVIVENKAGGSTAIGAEYVAKAAPDGYTLLMAVTTTISTNPFLFKKLPYKPSDFVPVALTGLTPYVLSAHPSVPVNSLKELIAFEKAKPGTLNLATIGPGSSPHLVGAMFNAAAGLNLNMVAYRGSGPALSDLMAGHVQLYFDSIATSAALFRSGKLKGFAISSERRSQAAPEVPTFAESGLPEMQAMTWYGLLAPARTPQGVIDVLNQATNEALLSPEVHARAEQDGASAPTMNSKQFAELIERHTKTWGRIIEPMNIQLD